MKKILVTIMVIIFTVVVLCLTGWYITFVTMPKWRVSTIAGEFETAARERNREAIEKLVTEHSLLRNVTTKTYGEYFDRFYNGVEITWCIRTHNSFFPSDKDRIWAGGKMKARIDGQYRANFEFLLEFEKGEWKLKQFSFPDFVDY